MSLVLRWCMGAFVVCLFAMAAYGDMDATTAPIKAGQGEQAGSLRCGLDCSAATVVSCPGMVRGQTIEEPNDVNSWPCGFTDPGGELIYAIPLETVVSLTVTILEHDQSCIDVYFVGTCSEQPCMWIGCKTGDARTVQNAGPGMVYIVVDRWADCAPGPYDFKLLFECEEPLSSCDYMRQCSDDLGGMDWYADGEWSSRDGLIYQIYHGGFLSTSPDIVVYDPQTCDIVRTYQFQFTGAAQHGIAVDTRNGGLWVAGWWNQKIYYLDDNGNLLHSFGEGQRYAGLAYDPDHERLWAVTNSAPDAYLVFDVHNPMSPVLLWGPTPVPWQCGGTFLGTNFNGAGLEYSPMADIVVFINQDAGAQECFHDNGDGTLTPMGCCQLAPLKWPWGCALVDGGFGGLGALYVTSLDGWPLGPQTVNVFETVCDAPLPVELVSFQATQGKDFITLRWATASESENDFFKIYRRTAGTDWQEIARVPSQGNGVAMRYYTHQDNHVRVGVTYEYLLSDVDNGGIETQATDKICQATIAEPPSPLANALHQNHPNPFNEKTAIQYDVAMDGQVRLRVFDITGRLTATLRDEYEFAGSHTAVFDAAGLPSGIYLISMDMEDFHQTMKVVLAK
jgi:hypothetical protein